MAKRKMTTEETVIRAREEGAAWWEIKRDLKVPVSRAKEIVKAEAPFVYGSVDRVRFAWRAHQMRKQGQTVPQIAEAIGRSTGLVYSALWIGECIEARRNGENLPGRPAWES